MKYNFFLLILLFFSLFTYTATYTLTAAPALSGKIRNTVLEIGRAHV